MVDIDTLYANSIGVGRGKPNGDPISGSRVLRSDILAVTTLMHTFPIGTDGSNGNSRLKARRIIQSYAHTLRPILEPYSFDTIAVYGPKWCQTHRLQRRDKPVQGSIAQVSHCSQETCFPLQRPLQDVLDGQRGDCRPRSGVSGWWRWSSCATRTSGGGQYEACDQYGDTGWLLHVQLPDGSSFSVADLSATASAEFRYGHSLLVSLCRLS